MKLDQKKVTKSMTSHYISLEEYDLSYWMNSFFYTFFIIIISLQFFLFYYMVCVFFSIRPFFGLSSFRVKMARKDEKEYFFHKQNFWLAKFFKLIVFFLKTNLIKKKKKLKKKTSYSSGFSGKIATSYSFTHTTLNEYMRLNYTLFHYKNYMVE